MAVLLLADHDNESLNDQTAKTLTACKAMGGDITILCAGDGCKSVAEQAAKLDGVAKVLCASDAAYGHDLAEPLGDLIVKLSGDYEHLVAGATTYGKNVMPRVAALLDTNMISDISAVEGSDTFERPIYAGNAMATVKSGDPKKVITSRRDIRRGGRGRVGAVEEIEGAGNPGISEWVEDKVVSATAPNSPRPSGLFPVGAAGLEGEFPDHREGRRQARRRRRRVARGGGFRLRAERLSGRARPARSSPRTSTSPSASPARSSTWPG